MGEREGQWVWRYQGEKRKSDTQIETHTHKETVWGRCCCGVFQQKVVSLGILGRDSV